tara:strand:+ start:2297 stop:2488 length:192 start_codon:yes stop_codon:yes gene_type:complete
MYKIQVNLPHGLYTAFKKFHEARGGSESDAARSMIEYYLVHNSFLSTHLKDEMTNNGAKSDDE